MSQCYYRGRPRTLSRPMQNYLHIISFRENILCEPTTALSLDEKADSSDEETDIANITTSDIVDLKDPLDKVKPGLRFEGDTLVPLQSVHIRAKLLDLCAKVVVMQVYNNSNSKPIEAKYVFPLDDMAAGKLAFLVFSFPLNFARI